MKKYDLLLDLLTAYYCARKNKRNTINQLKFEQNFESNLLDLHFQIEKRIYEPLPSIAFIVNKPVKREIFAADFRDRVVHHLIYNYISPIMEKYFIAHCCSCRKGKGTSYGVTQTKKFIRGCSENYTKDCFILKMDIQSYFMSMNKQILYEIVKKILFKEKEKKGALPFDEDVINYLLKVVIFNDPTKHCRIKGNVKNWHDLPKNKSLFYAKPNCGLPIGNLTSQLFGNVYLNCFDQFVKRTLVVKHYVRYVDDFVLVHQSKSYLKKIIPEMQNYLSLNLGLNLHPNKTYLQHYSKGLKFLGVVIKPYRIYIGSRVKGNYYQAIMNRKNLGEANFLIVSNSYLGLMKHYDTYKLQKKFFSIQQGENSNENYKRGTETNNNTCGLKSSKCLELTSK